jgi:uncharacterized membrane protein
MAIRAYHGSGIDGAQTSLCAGTNLGKEIPMANSISLVRHDFLHVEIRRVPRMQSLVWLRQGWEDLRQIRAPSIAHGALITALGAVLLILGSSHPYLVAAAVSGYLLVGPIMTTGLCELSRRLPAGERVGFDDSLSAIRRNPEGLCYFGLVLAIIAAVWFLLSGVLLQSVLHASGPSLAETLWGGMTDVASRSEVVAYVASGAILAAGVFSLSVVAVPLIIDRHASALDAMWISIRTTLLNLPAMLMWAGLIVVLTALGFVTFLIGMIIIAPLLGHATWHAYRDLIA